MTSSAKPTLFLIPSSLDAEYSGDQLPEAARHDISHLRHFAVENLRHARRYLRKLLPELVIDDCTFYEMGKHASPDDHQQLIADLNAGNDIGVISEAGLPGIADPGNNIVALAHRQGARVRPLIGPGSVFMALMSSGFNGQSFTFHGYLPRENSSRMKKIKSLEQTLNQTGYSQLFMETPYRNDALLGDILNTCQPETGLCIAADLTTPTEFIKTLSIADWKKGTIKLNKRPAIFVLGKL